MIKVFLLCLFLLIACGPSQEEVDFAIEKAISSIPSAPTQQDVDESILSAMDRIPPIASQGDIDNSIRKITDPINNEVIPTINSRLENISSTEKAILEVIEVIPALPTREYVDDAIEEAVSAIPEPKEELNWNSVWSEFTPSVFYIQVPSSSAYGSGWLYKEGLILTAAHVVENNTNVNIFQMAGEKFTGTVYAKDSSRDVALIKFDKNENKLSSNTKPLLFGNIKETHFAGPLMALGYSDRGNLVNQPAGRAAANVGVMSQVKVFASGGSDAIKHIMMDAPIAPGDSGGPVLDSEGYVLGMTRSYSSNPGTFFAIHEDVLREALVNLELGYSK